MMESCQLSTCAAGKLLAKASDPHFPLSVLRLRGGSGDALGESLEEDEFAGLDDSVFADVDMSLFSPSMESTPVTPQSLSSGSGAQEVQSTESSPGQMSYSSGEYGRDNIAEEDNHEHQGDFLPVLRLRGGPPLHGIFSLHPYVESPLDYDKKGWDMDGGTADPSRVGKLYSGCGAGAGGIVPRHMAPMTMAGPEYPSDEAGDGPPGDGDDQDTPQLEAMKCTTLGLLRQHWSDISTEWRQKV